MNPFAELLRILLLFPGLFLFCLFVPGFFAVRHLPLKATEKLACAVGASILMVYLYSGFIYALDLPNASHFVFTAVGLLLAIVLRKELWHFLTQHEVIETLIGFAALFIWTTGLLGLIRTYSGDDWAHDWYEHYHRTLFFLHRLPLDTVFTGLYKLPARPPAFNLLSSHLLAQIGGSYSTYQLVATLLNLLLFFAANLFFRELVPVKRATPAMLCILFGFNPVIMHNATYSWTKLLAAFFVLLATWFYYQSLKRPDPMLYIIAFGSIAMGLLVHYSVASFILVLTGHYLWRQLRHRELRWKQLASIAATCCLILCGWFGWSIRNYGLSGTLGLGALGSIQTAAQFTPWGNVAKVVLNLFNTLVPRFWIWRSLDLGTTSRLAYATDYCFRLYQQNLFLGVGSIGCFIGIWMIWKISSDPRRDRKVIGFWSWYVASAIIFGVAIVGERQPAGAAHLTLQPLVALGIVLVAAAWYVRSKLLRLLIVIGVSIDFVFGVAAHFAYEHLLFSELGSHGGYVNQEVKQSHGLVFLGDYWPPYAFLVHLALAAALLYLPWRREKAWTDFSMRGSRAGTESRI